jgi:PEGA domain
MTSLVVLSVWLAGFSAQAKPPTKAEMAEAQRRFQRATELYEEENNLPGALAEFRRAYAVAPNYRVLYNIGQLCFLLQDYPCALDAFTRYLGEGGSEVPAQRREEVQRDVTRLQTRVAKLRIISDKPGAEVMVDNVTVGKTPLREAVMVGAGRPQVRVTLAGYAPFTRVVEVASMETANVQVELLPLTAGSVAETPATVTTRPGRDEAPSASRAPVYGWIATGILAAAAGTTGFLALRASNDNKKELERDLMNTDGLAETSSRAKRLALTTDILLGATVVAAGISTYLSLSGSPHGEGVALVVGPGSIGLTGRY